jgi:hypothetical protein
MFSSYSTGTGPCQQGLADRLVVTAVVNVAKAENGSEPRSCSSRGRASRLCSGFRMPSPAISPKFCEHFMYNSLICRYHSLFYIRYTHLIIITERKVYLHAAHRETKKESTLFLFLLNTSSRASY